MSPSVPAVLRISGALGVLAFMSITVLEHFLRPDLSPSTHEISEYANGRHGALMTAGFALWAISLACTAGLVLRVDRGRLIALGLLIAAFGIAVAATFATQTSAGHLAPHETLHASGTLHDIGSGLATLALLVAAVLSLRIGTVDTQWLTAVVLGVAVAVDVALLAVGNDVAGVRQRVLVLVACVWQLAVLTLSVTVRRRRAGGAELRH
jgi:MFS family permease